MNAAIYARVSKEKIGATDDAKSPARQIENARAFAHTKGWTVNDAHIFVDDGISGAEFERRPGLQQLLAALKPRAPFTVLIVSEQKSIGREAFETNYTIKLLAQAGVEIFEYGHGQSLTPKTYMDKMMSSFRAGADEAHREQTSERVHESHTKSAKAGHVVGGRVFGYTNQDVFNGVDAHGRPLRSHVERVVNPTEEAVVRRIFTLYDSGEGLKRIAALLNTEGAPRPTPFVRKDPTKVRPVTGWAPGTVRAILQRELYRGQVVWNRTRKRPVTWGQVDQKPRPETDHIRVDAPQLRIIDEPLWTRVQARRREAETLALRLAGGRLAGRPPKTATANLLAGLATCAICGGGLVVETSARKRGRVPEYVCYRRRANGGCSNTLRMPVADLNEAVLLAVEAHALTPEAIASVVALTERDDVTDRQAALEREQQDVARRVARLVAAIETGGDAASLVTKLRELEARQAAMATELAGLRPVPRLAPAVVEGRLAEWRRLLRSSTTTGRTVLQRVLRGRVTFTPGPDGYTFSAPTRFDRLFAGVAAPVPGWMPAGRRGFEDTGPEDTNEGDYGRLLERAARVKVGTSPTGFATSGHHASAGPRLAGWLTAA